MDDYMKELRRLRKNLREKIRYYNKRGYNIDPSFVKELTVEELKHTTTEQLLNDIYDEQIERQEFLDEYQIFPDEVPMIIQKFRDSYSNYNDDAKRIIDTWLNGLIEMRGKDAVAIMLNEARWNGKEITNKDIYGDLLKSLEDFFYYLPEGYELNANEQGKYTADIANDIMELLEHQFDVDSYVGY